MRAVGGVGGETRREHSAATARGVRHTNRPHAAGTWGSVERRQLTSARSDHGRLLLPQLLQVTVQQFQRLGVEAHRWRRRTNCPQRVARHRRRPVFGPRCGASSRRPARRGQRRRQRWQRRRQSWLLGLRAQWRRLCRRGRAAQTGGDAGRRRSAPAAGNARGHGRHGSLGGWVGGGLRCERLRVRCQATASVGSSTHLARKFAALLPMYGCSPSASSRRTAGPPSLSRRERAAAFRRS